MAMEPASAAVKPSRPATTNVKKIPPCAAAPSRKLLGFAISGEKSVIQPMPRKIRGGYSCSLTPKYRISSRPPSLSTLP